MFHPIPIRVSCTFRTATSRTSSLIVTRISVARSGRRHGVSSQDAGTFADQPGGCAARAAVSRRLRTCASLESLRRTQAPAPLPQTDPTYPNPRDRSPYMAGAHGCRYSIEATLCCSRRLGMIGGER